MGNQIRSQGTPGEMQNMIDSDQNVGTFVFDAVNSIWRYAVDANISATITGDFTYTDGEIPSPYVGIQTGFRLGAAYFMTDGNVAETIPATGEHTPHVKSIGVMADNNGAVTQFSFLRSMSALSIDSLDAGDILATGAVGWDGTDFRPIRVDTEGRVVQVGLEDTSSVSGTVVTAITDASTADDPTGSGVTTVYSLIFKNTGNNPIYVKWANGGAPIATTDDYELLPGETISPPGTWTDWAAICDTGLTSELRATLNGV